MSAAEANRIAEDRGLDLVKISPNAQPPVCKIMDYGKYKFEQSKREKEARKNQKTVVQINTSDGGSYEAYLNTYKEFANAEGAILVTLPFSEFVDKGGRGILTNAAAAQISSFGLWVNAIANSSAIDENGKVSGVLYYDAIKAVNTEYGSPQFDSVKE